MIKLRGKHWLLGTAGLLCAYTMAGFWLLPWWLRDQIPQLAQTHLARPASVGAVRFNPYTLRLELKDLALSETDGAPLASLGQLTVDLEWSSLLQRAWNLAEIRLDAPRVHLVIGKNGDFNLARLLATLAPAPQPTTTPSALPRLNIGLLVLAQGQLDLRDEQAGYRNQLAPIAFTLTGFSTLPEHSGAYTLSAISAHGGTLRWKGSASVQPIRGSGELVLEDLSLPELAVYLPAAAHVRVHSGRLSATLPYRFSYAAGRLQLGLAQARLALRQPGVSVGPDRPPLQIGAGAATLQFQLEAGQAAASPQLKIQQASFALSELAVTSSAQTPLRLARLGFTDGSLDLAARQARLGRVEAEGAQLQLRRDRQGQVELLQLLSALAPKDQQAPTGAPWTVAVGKLALRRLGADVEDQGTGIRLHVQDAALDLDGAGTDLTQALRFDAGLSLREGGRLTARGSRVPQGLGLQADVEVAQVALAPLQPLLDQHLKLRIAGGKVSAQGQLTRGALDRRQAALRYVGSVEVSSLALTEEDGDLFTGWTSVGASRLTLSLQPNRLDIPELRLVDVSAKLHIDPDRSFNAARLQVRPATAAPQDAVAAAPPAAGSAAAETFPIRVRRVRLHNGKLDFADLSLRPPFAAQIHELGGMVNGLSSQPDARSQIELDGRVDAYGLARVRGELIPFAPGADTRIQASFQNVDVVSSSPYAAKYLGYQLTEGKIALDLQYTVRDGQLDGSGHLVADRLTLGEQVDSPDALELPVPLVLALLKDSNDRIDIDLPVSGNTRDPQFNYGGLIWQSLGQFIGKAVSSPFRLLGKLAGGDEALQAIQFDPGSARLLPPEREKLKQVAQGLTQRRQLKLSVPGHYHAARDGAALRTHALRLAVTRRAGVQLEAGRTGPPNLGDRAVREALRQLYAERFGDAALAQQRLAAEQVAPGAQVTAPLSLAQRTARMLQGEPLVADTRPYYQQLLAQLEQSEPLDAEALSRLGAQRAAVIVQTLVAEGVDPQSAAAVAPAALSGAAGPRIPLTLELLTR